MSSQPGEQLYNLLPALYRVRDSAQGEPLRALLAIISNEFGVIEADIAGLLENWFIETCDEWVVPYIGDLLGTTLLKPVGGSFTARRYVANTLRYRRQKGTAAMLEQLARDVTLWPARVVEFFQFLDTTQHLNHLRPQNTSTPDFREANALELLGGSFEQANHTVDLRAVDSLGKYNVPNIGIYLWRLETYRLEQSTARLAAPLSEGRYRFNPLGLDVPLFNQPEPLDESFRVADETQVPGSLRRRALYDDLEALRRGEKSAYFGQRPVLSVFSGNQIVPAAQIVACDLSDWSRPPNANSAGQPIQVAVDPLLGRIAFAANSIPGVPETVLVSHSYPFSGDLGGGPYDRRDSLRKTLAEMSTIDTNSSIQIIAVSQELTADNKTIFSTLSDAIASPSTGWNSQQHGAQWVIAILDSRTYEEAIPTILIPNGSCLVIVAADIPGLRNGKPLDKTLAPVGIRPHFRGNLTVAGAVDAGGTAGSLFLNGLLIEGTLSVKEGDLSRLSIAHCTLLPAEGSVKADDPALVTVVENPELEVSLERTICGALSLGSAVKFTAVDTIIDAADGVALSALKAAACIQTTTVLGSVGTGKLGGVRTLYAANSIFTGSLFVERRQTGCLRFCSLANDSRTPRRYRCQTGLAPVFTSKTYGQPGYAQLSRSCPLEIRTGADDGSEMGTFDFIKQPQREGNLRISLNEYLRFGLEAGVFFVS